MAQDYYAILVQPCSQATAEAGANNNEPMTPLRTKQAVYGLLSSGTDPVEFGVDAPTPGQGAKLRVRCADSPAGGHFYAMVGDDSGNSAIFTNGYLLIDGNAGLDGAFPSAAIVSGVSAYMFGIYTDVGANPMIVLKGDTGDFVRGYNGSDVLTFKVQINGSAQFGGLPFPSDPPVVLVGTNIASTASLRIGEGQVKSYYGGEADPRFDLHNNGSLTFITDGSATAATTGVSFKIVSDRVAAIATSNGTAMTNRLIANGTGEIYAGAINGQSLILTTAQRANYGNGLASRNLTGVDGADTYKTPTTGSAGYSGIEQMYGGDVVFYASSVATTADATVTPTERMRIKGNGGGVGIGIAPATGITLHVGGTTRNEGAGPEVQMVGTTEATDEKRWAWQSGVSLGGGILRLRAVNDAETNGLNAIQFTRDGIASVATALTGGPVFFASYTASSLPSAATAGGLIYVSDEAGGAVLAFSDGTNWRRLTDRAIVS
jgi:hypothetical protein